MSRTYLTLCLLLSAGASALSAQGRPAVAVQRAVGASAVIVMPLPGPGFVPVPADGPFSEPDGDEGDDDVVVPPKPFDGWQYPIYDDDDISSGPGKYKRCGAVVKSSVYSNGKYDHDEWCFAHSTGSFCSDSETLTRDERKKCG